MKDENILKKYKPEHFKIDIDKDSQGRFIEKKLEGFLSQKYTVQSVYTMTKYKLNLTTLRTGIEKLKKIKTFEDYVSFGNNDYHEH